MSSAILEQPSETHLDTEGEKGARGPGRPRCDQAKCAILQAAFDLLADNGYERFTIEAVAQRSGAAKTTIYRWWPGKGALAMDALLSHVEQNAPYVSTPCAIADLRTAIAMVAESFSGRTGRAVAGILMAGQSDPSLLETYFTQVVEPRREGLRAILRRGVAQGQLRADLSVEQVAEMVHALLVSRLIVRPQLLRQPGWSDELVDNLLRGMAA